MNYIFHFYWIQIVPIKSQKNVKNLNIHLITPKLDKAKLWYGQEMLYKNQSKGGNSKTKQGTLRYCQKQTH